MGVTLHHCGEFAAAQKEFEQSLALYDPQLDRSTQVVTNANSSTMLATAVWNLGYPERAAKLQAKAFSYAAELDRVSTTGFVHNVAGLQLEHLIGNVAAVLVHAKVLDILLSEHGIKSWEGMTSFYKGWAISSSDGAGNGIALMQQDLDNLQAKGWASNLSYFMSLLAQVYARLGDVQSALALSNDAQVRMRVTGEHRWLAELHRIEGEVRRAAGHALTDVEKCFDRALDVSRLQGAKMFELRAAISLARLWRDQGRHVEARDLLVPVYAWFTEGFDTVDLKNARTLLAELSE